MLFNSIDFAFFLPIVFAIYWLLKKSMRFQNLFLVIASYVFYGWWDWRFLSLMFYSTTLDFLIGRLLSKEENIIKRKLFLSISIVGNLGLLGFFKYYNFFLTSFHDAFTFFGNQVDIKALNIILPVGISFYTFQTLSYGIDVYRRKMQPTKNYIAFSAFVTFFPQLVAGPIERASNLLPQFLKERQFNKSEAIDGLRQILWGLFKKIVIADNSSEIANLIFNNSSHYSGYVLLLGAFFFALQIYCDISGYSDIAIGHSKLFGFKLMQNFAFPYFSRDIAEFWRRWHISLSTWFRDYLYIPLGGSKGGILNRVRNTFIIFIVSGFWHGANWTFIIWGALNAIYFLPLLLMGKNRQNIEVVAKGKVLPTITEFIKMLTTFLLTLIAWIFFRAETVTIAFQYLKSMVEGLVSISSLKKSLSVLNDELGLIKIFLILSFFLLEWLGREQKYAIEELGLKWNKSYRWAFYYTIIIVTIYFSGNQQEFIYFQF